MSYYPSPRPDPVMLLASFFIGAGVTLWWTGILLKLLGVIGG